MVDEIVWRPYGEYIERSNITRFMQIHDIKSYEELVRRSVNEIEWFWDAVSKFLGLEWFQPYTKVLDSSKGLPWAKWFLGGRTNIARNCIERHARSEKGDKLALIWESEDGRIRKYTYQQADEMVSKSANALKSLGAQKGDRIGIYMPMTPEAVFASFACAKIGAVYVPVFSGFGAQAVASRLEDCEAKLLLTANGYYRKGSRIDMKRVAEEASASVSTVEHVIVHDRLGEGLRQVGKKDLGLSELLAGMPSSCQTERTDSEDPFMIIYTSGTTGRPKGSVHVHGGFLVKIAQEVAFQFDMRQSDVLYWVTDMGWIMAPWELVGGLALGGTVFIYEGAIDHPKPNRIWEMVEGHGVTILGISPTATRSLMRYGDEWVKRHNLGRLRILGSTGEPWDPESYMWFFRVVGGSRCPIINITGGTEVGACFLSPLPIISLKPCTVGGPSLGMDVDVFDEDGRPVRGAVGELVCMKPWPGMTRGVWKDPDRYLESYWQKFDGVWTHGDLASIDEDGLWFLHGRSDDTIKVGGKRIGPAEVESAAAYHQAVLESAAIGVPDPVKGESIVCFVVTRTGYEHNYAVADEIIQTISVKLGKAFKPSEIRFVSQLPKTRNAKILRRLIKARYLGQTDLGDLSNLENPESLTEIRAAGT